MLSVKKINFFFELLFILTNLIKIVFIGTYPPRECGIGTFASNLFSITCKESVNQIRI